MALEEYKRKRRLGTKTPEPAGGKPGQQVLHFVVQKHHASHLHYDFRLELKGVLKSWAVPKGPSMDPAVRRSAFMVEDHPYDYKDFEGNIPKGQYGGGSVIIWDMGSFEPMQKKRTKKENEGHLLHQLYQGEMEFVLKGEKLKGKFKLSKKNERGENVWLLVKLPDQYAKKTDILKQNTSVVSGLTVEQMAENGSAEIWNSNRTEKTGSSINDVLVLIKKGKKSSKPKGLRPMKCELIDKAFDGDDWIFELKYDGYRIMADVNGKKVKLTTTEVKDYTKKYPGITTALTELTHDVLLDGEVVVLDQEGKSDFSLLQNYKSKQGSLCYYIFDLLWIDGYDITGMDLVIRKKILHSIIPESSTLRYVDHIDCEGKAMFELVKEKELEGIIAKRKDSRYLPGQRSKSWLKLPHEVYKEYIIIGWSESTSKNLFARILYGEMKGGKLYYKHHTGSSVSKKLQQETMEVLKRLEIKKKPVVNKVEEDKPVHWVKPIKVGRFKLKNLKETTSGKPRHPVIYLGFRDDKLPGSVTEEKIIPVEKVIEETDKENQNAGKQLNAVDELQVWKQLHKKEIKQTQRFELGKIHFDLINTDQQYWQNGITKADVLNYYAKIHETILHYLKDRPLGLNIVNEWGGEEGTFIRNAAGLYPKWVKIFSTKRRQMQKEKSQEIDWVICNDVTTLMYLVNLGALDFHPWSARKQKHQYPDYIVIDIDPYDRPDVKKSIKVRELDRKNLVKTALATKAVLDDYNLIAFIKTSGKKGLHIFVPCAGIKYGDTRKIAEKIATEVSASIPKIATTETSVAHRKGKVYIDPSQNDYSDRVAVAYCLRANKIPTISTPLEWQEVNEKLDVKKFKMNLVLERLTAGIDPFAKLFDAAIQKRNSKILKSFFKFISTFKTWV